MGNRAVIKTENSRIGVYLQWNGGRDSIEAFLKYCEMKGYRSPETDGYGWARLAQVIGNFFGGTLSVGMVEINGYHDGEGCDNGAYVIRKWKIVGREDFSGPEQNEYSMNEMLKAIDEAQPVKEQFGDFLDMEEVDVKDVKVGDVVAYIETWSGQIIKEKVIGIGGEGCVNGQSIRGIPFVGRFDSDSCPAEMNINNYLRMDKIRIASRTEN